jgi:hypothetical protein
VQFGVLHIPERVAILRAWRARTSPPGPLEQTGLGRRGWSAVRGAHWIPAGSHIGWHRRNPTDLRRDPISAEATRSLRVIPGGTPSDLST